MSQVVRSQELYNVVIKNWTGHTVVNEIPLRGADAVILHDSLRKWNFKAEMRMITRAVA